MIWLIRNGMGVGFFGVKFGFGNFEGGVGVVCVWRLCFFWFWFFCC